MVDWFSSRIASGRRFTILKVEGDCELVELLVTIALTALWWLGERQKDPCRRLGLPRARMQECLAFTLVCTNHDLLDAGEVHVWVLVMVTGGWDGALFMIFAS